jgi:hypothetical protein
MLAAAGPTHLPPVSDEIQRVAVDAEGGSYTLTFTGDTTVPLAFDVSPSEVEAALNALPAISSSGGAVEVSGGPGSAFGVHPYFVRFIGAYAGTNVSSLLSADSTQLTGAGHVANTSVRTEGGSDGTGEIMVGLTNVGGAATNGTPIEVEFELPIGLTASATSECAVVAQEVTCTRSTVVPPAKSTKAFVVPISVTSSAPPASEISVMVKGGGAFDLTEQMTATVSPVPAEPGVQAVWAGAFDENGALFDAAGGHPYSAGAGFYLNTILAASGKIIPAGDLRQLEVDLPPGFVGNPTTTGRCPQDNLGGCIGARADVGWADGLTQNFGYGFQDDNHTRLFSGVAPYGHAAIFTFKVISVKISAVDKLRSDEDYGVTLFGQNIPTAYRVYGAVNMIEGLPVSIDLPPVASSKAFLTNPTDCSTASPVTVFTGNTWQVPDLFDEVSTPVPAMTGCANLDFEPQFTFQPSATTGSTPVATTAHLHIDQARLLDPNELAPPHLKDSTVVLPEGLNLNPSAANGLQACSTAQIGFKGNGYPMPNPTRFDKSSPRCPDASKIGTATIDTPLLEDPLQGTVYLAAQGDNPFNSLIAMYLVIDDEQTGITVKLPGKVTPDPKTGQLTASFENNPQLPFEDLTLSFRGGGPRSTLATPDVCGAYETKGSWTPWSAPESGPPAQTSDSFTVAGNCAATKAQRPFTLGLSAGTTSPVAGKHSPFTLRLTRPDGNQEIDTVSATMPEGLLAKLAGVGICSDAQIAKAIARSNPGDGAKEISGPSCPASSQVGTTTIGAGVGSEPIYVKTGKAYLTGPYKGAPASITFVVPAVAGPFDLGVQVVRTALQVNPKTAQVTAVSDPIPQILAGIPVQIRDVIVNVDRGNFILNPTDCSETAVTAKVTGASGAVANLTNRFQVDGCRNLPFKPKLKIQLHGSTKRAKYQRLEATLTARPGDANIASTSVALPHSEFLAQEHIRTVCTRVQFAAGVGGGSQCPAGSVYGTAEATSPLIDGKLTGPVYLRSSDNPLPDLVVALKGPDAQPIEVELAGRTDSVNGGIRNTFDVVPDAPVSKFTLRMFGGKKSLIINSRDLCKGKPQKATVKFGAQNGKSRELRTVVGNDCGKKEGKARTAKKSRAAG